MNQPSPINQPPEQPVQMVAFEFNFIQRLANYLSTKPYVEVFEFINQIQVTVQSTAQGLQLDPRPDANKPEEE